MTLPEFELVGIAAAVLAISRYVSRQGPRRIVLVFFLACLTGFAAQLLLGREMNLYTPNIRLYVSYVSLAVIVTWGIGLLTIYAVYLWAACRLRIRSSAVLFFLCSLPVIVALEFVGSNVLRMKLHDYTRYSPLMPMLNSMHAPAWLYGYYGLIACLFYLLLKALGLERESRSRSVSRAAREQPAPGAVGEYE